MHLFPRNAVGWNYQVHIGWEW